MVMLFRTASCSVGEASVVGGSVGIGVSVGAGVSVTTINGGTLRIRVTGETGEGDGIDSNGWLVINGGTVVAEACSQSADAGIDSDMGIHINGGTVIATGSMLDRIEEGGQNYAVVCNGFREDVVNYDYTVEIGQWDDLQDNAPTISGFFICEWDG